MTEWWRGYVAGLIAMVLILFVMDVSGFSAWIKDMGTKHGHAIADWAGIKR